jgi:hypothetical protein
LKHQQIRLEEVIENEPAYKELIKLRLLFGSQDIKNEVMLYLVDYFITARKAPTSSDLAKYRGQNKGSATNKEISKSAYLVC